MPAKTKKFKFSEVRNCRYSKCGIEFTATRKNQFYHAAKCKQADWHSKSFTKIQLSETAIKAIKEYNSQPGIMTHVPVPRPQIDPEVWLKAKRELHFEYTQSQVLRLLKEFREA